MIRSRLDRYLLYHFSTVFFPMFMALFLIVSVIAFVQLSNLTAVLKVSFYEMALLYVFQLPQTFIYTLPITFFASVMLTFARLSGDLELIVLFSLRVSIWRILRPFFVLAVLLAVSLAIIGLQLQPKADFLRKALIYTKQDEVQINIKASEFGQKFGDWLLFVGSEENSEAYKDVVLFSRDDKNGRFIVAKEARVDNLHGVLMLDLINGRSYQTDYKKIVQVDFESMRVNEQGSLQNLVYEGIVGYWGKIGHHDAILKEFLWTVGAIVFVVISLPATALGVYNPRFEKNRAAVLAIVLALTYFIPIMTLCVDIFCFSVVVPFFWLLVTGYFVQRRMGNF